MNQHLTPDEVEVGRRNLIAELQDAVGQSRTSQVRISITDARDLIAVLEASKPTVVDREAIAEAAAIRAEYIRGQVNRRIDFRDGDATTGQIEQWESQAAEWWANRWPALAALYPKATEGMDDR